MSVGKTTVFSIAIVLVLLLQALGQLQGVAENVQAS